MTCQLLAVCFDSNNPLRLARFWGGVLGWEMADDTHDGVALLPSDDTRFRFRFLPTQKQKSSLNERHFHLTSTSVEDQQQTVARSLELGARQIDIGQRPEEGHVVLADPEGNEFCVIEPDNKYLAGCGFLGELTCAGSREVGYFWSEALCWPLVWDQGLQTAIRSPQGGPKISWDGERMMPQTGQNRLHFDLAPPSHGDQQDEVDRLVSLGATCIDIGQREASGVAMADPDGREFCVLTPRYPDQTAWLRALERLGPQLCSRGQGSCRDTHPPPSDAERRHSGRFMSAVGRAGNPSTAKRDPSGLHTGYVPRPHLAFTFR
jgi:predicted enzyme related to lactoylglutathione lyase